MFVAEIVIARKISFHLSFSVLPKKIILQQFVQQRYAKVFKPTHFFEGTPIFFNEILLTAAFICVNTQDLFFSFSTKNMVKKNLGLTNFFPLKLSKRMLSKENFNLLEL